MIKYVKKQKFSPFDIVESRSKENGRIHQVNFDDLTAQVSAYFAERATDPK